MYKDLVVCDGERDRADTVDSCKFCLTKGSTFIIFCLTFFSLFLSRYLWIFVSHVLAKLIDVQLISSSPHGQFFFRRYKSVTQAAPSLSKKVKITDVPQEIPSRKICLDIQMRRKVSRSSPCYKLVPHFDGNSRADIYAYFRSSAAVYRRIISKSNNERL